MPAQVRCPSCGRTYTVAAPPVGKTVRCQQCGHQFRASYVGRYQVLEEIGRGGFGVVHRVFDPKMSREAALKVLHPHIVRADGSGELLRRFRNEAQLLAGIVHPNIPPLYEADEHAGQLYLVSALIPGQGLDALIPSSGFPDPRRAVALVLPLLNALHDVHSRYNICHRDVKPANIMVDGDKMFLLDFGLAVCQDQEGTRITVTGTTMGTPAYMSPEQAAGDPTKVGPNSDQYSAGVVLFHLLTGQVPFRKPLPAVYADILTTPPPQPSALRPDLDAEMDGLVLKALAKDPGARYRDCRAFADLLRDWSDRYTAAALGASQASSRPVRGAGPGPRASAKAWAAVVGAVLTAAVLAVVGYFLLGSRGPGTAAPPSAPTAPPDDGWDHARGN